MILKRFSNSVSEQSSMLPKFLALFLVGFSMIFAGVIILVIATVLSGGSVDFGAVIFIGPFPIVVGAGADAEWMVLFAVILSVLSIIVFFLLRGEVERVKVQS